MCLMLLYVVFKYVFKTSFFIRVFLYQTSVLDNYFYQYALLIAVAFTISYHLLIKKYSEQTLFKRIFIFAPFICLITLFFGAFLSGILFSIYDVKMGFYPGFSRFLSNVFENVTSSVILSPFIVMDSLTSFTIVLSICSVIMLELLRERYKTTPSS